MKCHNFGTSYIFSDNETLGNLYNCCLNCIYRQRDDNLTTGSIFRVNIYFTTETLYYVPANIQSQSGTRFKVIYLRKPFKYPLLLIGRYTDTGIGHCYDKVSFFFICMVFQYNLPLFCKLYSIA